MTKEFWSMHIVCAYACECGCMHTCVHTHTRTHINPELHTMPKARDIRVNTTLPGFTELNENANLHLFCGAFGWICYIILFLLVYTFPFFLALLGFLLSPLTVTVNYIWEFRGMRPLSQHIKRPLFYFCIWCSALQLSGHFWLVSISGLETFR